MTELLDFRQPTPAVGTDVEGLRSRLGALVAEPFRFARVSYGDELTLHFGELRSGKSPRRSGHQYGAYILGLRASPWLVKSGGEPVLVSAGVVEAGPGGAVLGKQDLESGRLIQSGIRVVSATPFVLQPAEAFGLDVRFSDGTSFSVVPKPHEPVDEVDEALPELADWELLSPHGLLSAGPGLHWRFEPSAE